MSFDTYRDGVLGQSFRTLTAATAATGLDPRSGVFNTSTAEWDMLPVDTSNWPYEPGPAYDDTPAPRPAASHVNASQAPAQPLTGRGFELGGL